MTTILSERNLKFFAVILLLSFCTISQVRSQSLNVNDYAKYRVKPGDSMQYRYSRVIIPGFNYFNQSFYNPTNFSSRVVKISQGTLLTITITNVTQNPNNAYVQANETVVTPNGEVNKIQDIPPDQFLLPSFDNQTILISFINALNNQSMSPKPHYHSDSTYFYIDSVYSSSVPSSNSRGLVNLTISYNYIINWHTGWLESLDMVSMYSNGTIIRSVRIDRASNDLIDLALSTGMNLMVFILPIAIISIILFAVVSYKRSNKAKPGNTDKSSFTHYLATNFKKQKQKPQTKKLEIDRSLKIIDEILKDSENG